MNIPKLDERLSAAASFARQGKRAADIGTDHGYLPSYLVKKGISVSALACDVRKSPLENAEKTVRQYGLEDKIQTVLSDGLESLEPGCADDIILAGMGGLLIEEILQKADWIKKDGVRIIAQPMTHPEAVRRYFARNGFEIKEETAVTDGRRLYAVIAADYTGEIKEPDEAFFYFGTLFEKNDAACALYLKKQCDRLKKRYDAIKNNAGLSDESEKLGEILFEYERRAQG